MSTIVTTFLQTVAKQPDRVAFSFYGQETSYGALAVRAQRAAGALPPAGVILIFLPQSPEAIGLYLGAMWAGAIPSFMPLPSIKQDPQTYWRAYLELLALIKPVAIITDTTSEPLMRDVGVTCPILVPAELDGPLAQGPSGDSAAIALLQHSSGTTGLKKGVALRHDAVIRQVRAYAKALDASAEDGVASWLPVYHDMGLIACTLMPLMLGQRITLLDPFKWTLNPSTLFEMITRDRSTLCWQPNFAFEHMVRTTRPDPGRFDLSSVRAFISCSEPCKWQTFDRFAKRFAQIGVRANQLQVCYAMAETVFAVSQTRLGQPPHVIEVDETELSTKQTARQQSPGVPLLSCGPSIEGVKLRIQDDNGNLRAPGEVGEIVVSSDFLFNGYYNRPDVTEERLAEGLYKTNDIGFILDDEVFILGRKDDLMIVHGRNYYAHEIEASANASGLKPGRNVAINIFNPVVGSDDVVLIAEADEEISDPVLTRRMVDQRIIQDLGLELYEILLVPPGWLVKTTSGKISRDANRTKYLRERESRR